MQISRRISGLGAATILASLIAAGQAPAAFADSRDADTPAVAAAVEEASEEPKRRRKRGASSCSRLTGQIEYQETLIDEAIARGDELWEENTRRNVDRLRRRRSDLCPEYDKSVMVAIAEETARETRRFFKTAADAAARYFSFGAF